MKFYSDELDRLFDTQEALEQAEAREKAKSFDANKEAEVARIKDLRGKLEKIRDSFNVINEERKKAEFAFVDTYGPEAWMEVFGTAEQKEVFAGLQKLKEALGVEGFKAEKPRKPRVEVLNAHSDLGAAIHEFLKGVR